VAILFPAACLLVAGWDSGEHAGAVVLFGVLVSAILGVVWMVAWFACRRHSLSDRQAMFGVGASVGLAGSIAVGNMTDELVSAALTCAVITAMVVAVATRRAKTAPGGT
jgi:hypothetical protein